MAKPMTHSPIRDGGVHSNTRKRGAKPSHPYRIFASAWHQTRASAIPLEMTPIIPAGMTMQGNDQYGDCVTAEEAAAKEYYSLYCGLPELKVPDQVTIDWASKYGDLNGANLIPVMDQMATDGLTVNGVNYKDGPHDVVDFTDEQNLKSSLLDGPVKIAIDANALSPDAGNGNGWWNVGGSPGEFSNTDHCISIFYYCTAGKFFAALNMPVPAGIDPNEVGYVFQTWSTVGWGDHAWLMATCTESHVRNPTTVGQTPPNPAPNPDPGPGPNPNPTPNPVPANPVVVVPDKVVQVPHGLWGTVPVTIPGGTYPVVDGTQAAINPAVFGDVVALFFAFMSKNQAAISAALAKLLADLGMGHHEVGAINPAVFGDVIALFFAFMSKNPVAISAALAKLLADLGIGG